MYRTQRIMMYGMPDHAHLHGRVLQVAVLVYCGRKYLEFSQQAWFILQQPDAWIAGLQGTPKAPSGEANARVFEQGGSKSLN